MAPYTLSSGGLYELNAEGKLTVIFSFSLSLFRLSLYILGAFGVQNRTLVSESIFTLRKILW